MGCGASKKPVQPTDKKIDAALRESAGALAEPEWQLPAREPPAARRPGQTTAGSPRSGPGGSSFGGAGPSAKRSSVLPAHIEMGELTTLCQSSHFDRTQVENLYELFKAISASGEDDGLIDKTEFQKAMGLKRNLFVDRMFELFDANGDQSINFQEFVAGLSVFTTRAKEAEKTKFSFRMYDFNGDEMIDKHELGRMLQATIDENKLNITREQARQLIDDTFEEAQTAKPGQISFEEYAAMVSKKPQLLEFMTIQSLNSMISS